MNKKRISIIVLVALAIASVFCYTQLTFFVIQPIGVLPEGKTLIISRLTNVNFIDSADAICERVQGEVSLFGRVAVMSRVFETARIYARLPYSEWLYLISTHGKSYDR